MHTNMSGQGMPDARARAHTHTHTNMLALTTTHLQVRNSRVGRRRVRAQVGARRLDDPWLQPQALRYVQCVGAAWRGGCMVVVRIRLDYEWCDYEL